MATELEITALPWLERLLSITTFFSVCNVHPDAARNECNKYCLDCNERPLCNSCIKTSEHKDHRIIQIRRSSYNDVVKATDIEDHVDINGIQTYVINGSKVVFLSRRYYDQVVNIKRKNYKCTCNCRVCNRNLVEASDFCSLACKLQWVKVKGTFVLRPSKYERKGKKSEETTKTSSSSSSSNENNENLREGARKRKLEEEKEEEKKEQEAESGISRPTSFRPATSRRKGIPHRAPFF